jgi:hypothetical protein
MRSVAETPDPFFDLLQQGRAYREAALDSPHFYDVMFGHPIPQFTPDADDLEASRIAHDLLSAAVERVIATGALVAGADADDIAQWLWTVAHGVVSLELNGALDLDAAQYDRYLGLSLAGFLVRRA